MEVVSLTNKTSADLQLLEKGNVIICTPAQVCLNIYLLTIISLTSKTSANLQLLEKTMLLSVHQLRYVVCLNIYLLTIISLTSKTSANLWLLEKGDIIICTPAQVCFNIYLLTLITKCCILVGCDFMTSEPSMAVKCMFIVETETWDDLTATEHVSHTHPDAPPHPPPPGFTDHTKDMAGNVFSQTHGTTTCYLVTK